MHLKPYWKLQKKEHPPEVSRETQRTPMNHQKAVNDETCKASHITSSVFPSASLDQPLLIWFSCGTQSCDCVRG
ncbi:F-box protein 34, isoform CRA_b [Homo sapiens]|nr:F-box protein 34, isoform CRA_b [Homo sapiens]